jgi:amino acid adenylation domain-containing protein
MSSPTIASLSLDGATRATILKLGAGREPSTPALDVLWQIDAQVKRRGSHTAVRATDAILTYAQLDTYAGRAAAFLRGLGVVPEAKVGVSLDRGAFELLALIGTLRAGGAYVPLDPSHPSERLRLVLDDARPQILVLDDDSALDAAAPEGTRIVRRSEFVAAARAEGGASLPVSAPGERQLSYILYTSGSTGTPKGVEIERGAFANFITSMQYQPGFAETDCLLAITTTTFDIAGLELFLPLCVGGTVEIAAREVATDPKRLRERVESPTTTVLQATPATWRLLIAAGWKGQPRLKILCGGEAMSPELAASLLERCGELWNMYGPTETTVWSTLERIPSAPAREPLKITIGRPIDRTRICILGPEHTLMPLAEVGEIFIGGDGLARGYHQRPELTLQKFVQSPFEGPGCRLYGTGDLGRLLPDGRIECLGRIDHQVKIRGYRIELGEIESVLLRYPGVKDAVVVAVEQGAEKQLVAFYTGARELPALDLRAHLLGALPVYMVPGQLLYVQAIPVNTNGKVDRRALSELARATAASAEAPDPSIDESDESAADRGILESLRSILMVRKVDVTKSFIELGGDSLSSIRAGMVIERKLGWLPKGWERQPIRALLQLKPKQGRLAFSSVDSPIVARSIGILIVLLAHFYVSVIYGANTLLFVLAGWSLGKYQLLAVLKGNTVSPLLKTAISLAIPAMVFNLITQGVHKEPVTLAMLLMINTYNTPDTDVSGYWFVNALVHIYLILAIALISPTLRRWLRDGIFVPAVIGTAALLGIAAAFHVLQSGDPIRNPLQELWLILLGIAIAHADSPRRRWIVASFALALGRDIPDRLPYAFAPVVLIIVVIFVDRISLPDFVARLVRLTAGASLFIYLSHYLVHDFLSWCTPFAARPKVAVVLCLLAGILLWKLWERVYNPAYAMAVDFLAFRRSSKA